jgi:DNA (cytosine-5)-methyltransferase 1
MPSPTPGDGWFSGRTISEKILYPWLNAKGLRTAKSGWQTRTYERLAPYSLVYPENIAYIKDSFLGILDYASKNFGDRIVIVAAFIRREIEHRDQLGELKKKVSKSKIGNDILIMDILGALNEHFSFTNSAHLPVVAIHSIYEMLIEQVSQYLGCTLRPLESHQASDLRTGAVGDIEIEDTDGDVVEGVEVKHGLRIDLPILMAAEEKILKSRLKRYYILTTHSSCNSVDQEVRAIIRKVYKSHGG